MKLDLHLHTTYSDGRQTPAELAAALARAKVTHAAVTDHDSVASFAEVLEACAAHGIKTIPGGEISSAWNGHPIHILAYGFHPADAALLAFLSTINTHRRNMYLRQLPVINANLRAAGKAPIKQDRLEQKPTNYFSPVGLARFMIEQGLAGDIGQGIGYLKGVSAVLRQILPAAAIAQIHGAGGRAVLAHPLAPRLSLREASRDPAAWEQVLAEWRAAGLDGLEAYTPAHGPADTELTLQLAGRHGLFVTGGSDWHGPLKVVGEGILEYIPHYAAAPGAPGMPAAAARRTARELGL